MQLLPVFLTDPLRLHHSQWEVSMKCDLQVSQQTAVLGFVWATQNPWPHAPTDCGSVQTLWSMECVWHPRKHSSVLNIVCISTTVHWSHSMPELCLWCTSGYKGDTRHRRGRVFKCVEEDHFILKDFHTVTSPVILTPCASALHSVHVNALFFPSSASTPLIFASESFSSLCQC